MITANQIQIALIARMKANAAIVASLPAGANEIREDQWHGESFSYPNIRVDLLPVVPIGNFACDLSMAEVDILIHSITPSSLQCETISAVVVNQLHNTHFIYNSIQFSIYCINQTPARYYESEGLWRAIVRLRMHLT